MRKLALNPETYESAAELRFEEARKLYNNPKTQPTAMKPFAQGMDLRRAGETARKSEASKAVQIMKKLAGLDYAVDFLAGADPTGKASYERAIRSTDHTKTRRTLNDVGGFTLGAGVSSALTAGSLAIASKFTKGHLKGILSESAKDTLLVFHPTKVKKYLKELPDAASIVNKQVKGSHNMAPFLEDYSKLHNSASQADMVEAAQKHYGNKAVIEKQMGEMAAVNEEAKKFTAATGDTPHESARKGAAIAATLASGVMGGTMNALTSDIQYDAGLKMKAMKNKKS